MLLFSVCWDLFKIIGASGLKAIFYPSTPWKNWISKYVPHNVSNATVIAIYSLASMIGRTKEDINKHKIHNDREWDKCSDFYNKYIEYQIPLKNLKYGKKSADVNTCGVIAAYNTLQFFTNGNSPYTFPELISLFEKRGITMQGEFGTSPDAINRFFKRNGYKTKMIISSSSECKIERLQDHYKAYIILSYNDIDNLFSMVHYVSITNENGSYIIHNNGKENEVFQSLKEAIVGYGEHNGKAICCIGIGGKKV